MDGMKKWIEIYRAEIEALENSNDEEEIMKQVAEFEAELRKDFANQKAEKIEHKKSIVASLEEVVSRQADLEEGLATEIVTEVEGEVVVDFEKVEQSEKPSDYVEPKATVVDVAEVDLLDEVSPFENL